MRLLPALALYFFGGCGGGYSLPLQPNSLISLRTTETAPSAGGNVIRYKQLILEEWSSTIPTQLLQSWQPSCTLPDIQSETMSEGQLSSSYPYGDGIWFLCRNVSVGATFLTTPIAPVVIMNLQETGELITWSSDITTYAGITSTTSVLHFNQTQTSNVFYLLGGAVPSLIGTNPSPAQPRIRVDTGPRTQPTAQGPLTYLALGTTPNGLAIMTDTLFMRAGYLNGTTSSSGVFQIGTENKLPNNILNPSTFLFAASILSFYSYPAQDGIWWIGFNRLPFLAYTNFTISDPTQQTQRFTTLPGAGPSGSLGGAQWRVSTARNEGDNTIYITNGTNVMKNDIKNLVQSQPFQNVLQAPLGWKYMDVHARVLISPAPWPSVGPSSAPSSSSTPTSSFSPSISSTSSITVSTTATSLPTSTPTPTTTQTPTPTTGLSPTPTTTTTPTRSVSSSIRPTPTPTTSVSSTSTPTSSASTSASSSPTPSRSPSSLPPDSNTNSTIPGLPPAVQAGISVGVITAAGVLAAFGLYKMKGVQNMYTRYFGKKTPNIKAKGPNKKAPSGSTAIEISLNPYHLSQARIAQLKQMQDFNTTTSLNTFKMKKQFHPTTTGVESSINTSTRSIAIAKAKGIKNPLAIKDKPVVGASV